MATASYGTNVGAGGGGGGGGGSVNSVTATANTGISVGGTATDPVLAGIPSTTVVPGTMSAADKTKLDAVVTVTFGTGLSGTTTITVDLATGIAGGGTAIGGTLTTQNLTLRPNGADTTTGRVIVSGLGLSTVANGTAAQPAVLINDAGWYRSSAGTMALSCSGVLATVFNVAGVVVQSTLNTAGYYLGSGGAAAFLNDGSAGLKLVTGSVDRFRITSTGGITFPGTATFGAFGAAAVGQQTVGAATNNVTSGGSSGVIADYTDLVIYANDAAAIRNNVYQLARGYVQLATAMRNLGLGA